MSFLLDLCQFTTATTGTGAITVGSAVSPYRTPAAAGAVDGQEYTYFIIDGADFERGTGVYASAGATLTRSLGESSTGSLLNLSGSATVTITPSAEDLNLDDAFRRLSIFGSPVISGLTGGVITTDANGAATVNNNITLTNDAFLRDLTLGASGIINTVGYRIFVSGVLDLTAAASNAIRWNPGAGGNSGSQLGGSAGGALSAQTLGGSGAGTSGAAATTTAGAVATTNAVAVQQIGGSPQNNSGGGGSGASGAGGAASTNSNLGTSQRSYPLCVVTELLRGASQLQGGGGGRGGSSGGNDGTATSGGGGGGGSGGGIVAIFARQIVLGSNTNPGILRALGGNGGNGNSATSGNRGGGGGGSGGGGGAIYLVTERITGGAGLAWVWADGGNGGNGGTGFGTGTAGTGGGGAEGGVIIAHILSTGRMVRVMGANGGTASGTTGGTGGQCRWTL